MVLAAALGYRLHTCATKMAQLTPPRKPVTLLYTPRRSAQSFITRSAVRKVWMLSTCEHGQPLEVRPLAKPL